MSKLLRVVIKEELVKLTGDFKGALILNQLIYWSERMKDTDKWINEENERALKGGIELGVEESNGWIYKKAEELAEETMIGISPQTVRRTMKSLIERGFIQERRNPKYKWDKMMQYRVDLVKVQTELYKLGYSLEGYKLLDGVLDANKKATTSAKVEGSIKTTKSNNSICNANTNNTPCTEKNIQENNDNDANEDKTPYEILKENGINISPRDEEKINSTCTDLDKLKEAIVALKDKNSFGAINTINAYERVGAINSSNKKGILSYEGDYVNDIDIDKRIEEQQRKKFGTNMIEHKFI